ncbi:hypothetical protein [Granulosicoccus antarcticus]|uniref:YscD/Y4YQ C-terminal domain-containing protein n=1 Tax=Granulosicoccus antarcticus IMCC3135 TaxID=1192854 RepID=A0A2Z2NH88_9GAMM|nr:hypothetical protein [Granulosicoccus antarcticus]ASJ70499.1 hypothetical protein IMCC3135_01925 [Granulosicoccus antarcticus IMCC3135]
MNAVVEPTLERQKDAVLATTPDSPAAATTAIMDNLRGKLTILNGAQQGAVEWLTQGNPLSLGCSLDNDIVLRNRTVEQLHASLLLSPENMTIRCLGGIVVVNGISLNVGESMPLTGSGIVQLGEISVNVECVAEPALQGHAVKVPAQEGLAEDADNQAAFFMPSIDDLPATINAPEVEAAAEEVALAPPPRHFLSRKSSWLVICSMVAGAWVVWQSGLFRPVESGLFELQPALAESSFSGLQVSQFGAVATVSGFLETVQESRQLDQWLDQTGLNISNEVVVGETMAGQVLDVFRVYGIAAEVEVKEGGHVVVATSQPDNIVLDGVDESINSDMPGVASLTINNTPPLISEPVTGIKMDPGKRVAMVVSDEPAYIVTEDQSRYFVGSILPTGHRIASIKEGKVNLEINGVSSTLEF